MEYDGGLSESISYVSDFEAWELEFSPIEQESITPLVNELGRLSLDQALPPPSQEVLEANEQEIEALDSDYAEEEQSSDDEPEAQKQKPEKPKQNQPDDPLAGFDETSDQMRQAAYDLIFATTAIPVDELSS